MALFESASSDALIDLLERERLAMLEGRFDQLERMTAEKARLSQAVAAQHPDIGTLSTLKRLSARNAKLLDAMQRGISAALRRIEAINNGPAPLRTYSATGQRQNLAGDRSKMEHRA